MRIDGTIHPEPFRGPAGKAPTSKSKPGASGGAGASADTGADTIRSGLVALAMSAPHVNAQAVEEARRALAAGELDTPEAARRAAEAILDKGW